jgi:hypothetical protein
MKFTYSALRNASRNGDRVGNWKGYPVFACEKENLDRKSEGAYFIVYDNDNYIVRKIGNQWYSYGQVSESGNVTEWDYKKKYIIQNEYTYHYDTQAYEPAAAATAPNVCGKQEECDAAHEVVVGDVKLGLDVDATLKAAREMTVNSLLEGFNYGLDVKG